MNDRTRTYAVRIRPRSSNQSWISEWMVASVREEWPVNLIEKGEPQNRESLTYRMLPVRIKEKPIVPLYFPRKNTRRTSVKCHTLTWLGIALNYPSPEPPHSLLPPDPLQSNPTSFHCREQIARGLALVYELTHLSKFLININARIV